jgi:hypothetical protein
MADAKQRLLDVWLLEIDTVYREVPYVVVTDWVQQGRLLGDDCVRIAGSKKWHAIGSVPALAPYLPRAEPQRADDQAEALEPVELGLDWKRPGEDDDEDVDMIPLIDISLVLLIFFMMTASVSSGMMSSIATPAAQHQLAEFTKGMVWVGIDSKNQAGVVVKDDNGRPLPWFSYGNDSGKKDGKRLLPTRDFTQVTDALAQDLKDAPAGEVKIRLRAEKTLPIEIIKGTTLDLQDLESRLNRSRGSGKLTFAILGEVSEPKGR